MFEYFPWLAYSIVLRATSNVATPVEKSGACEVYFACYQRKLSLRKSMCRHIKWRVRKTRVYAKKKSLRCKCIPGRSYVTFHGPRTKRSISIHAIAARFIDHRESLRVTELDRADQCSTFRSLLIASSMQISHSFISK